jgi:hypothetical protein
MGALGRDPWERLAILTRGEARRRAVNFARLADLCDASKRGRSALLRG